MTDYINEYKKELQILFSIIVFVIIIYALFGSAIDGDTRNCIQRYGEQYCTSLMSRIN